MKWSILLAVMILVCATRILANEESHIEDQAGVLDDVSRINTESSGWEKVLTLGSYHQVLSNGAFCGGWSKRATRA